MSILGVNDPYIIPGTMGGGGGASLPVDAVGYLFNDGAGNYSWDAAATPEAAGSTTQIQYNDGGTMGGAAGLLYDKTAIDLTVKDVANDAYSGSFTFLKARTTTGIQAGQDADVLGSIYFKGYNDNATPELITFAEIKSAILDASDGSEDGCIDFSVMCQGVWRRAMRITKDTNNFYGVSIGDPDIPLAALHVDSTSLDFVYAAKIVNTIVNRGALYVEGPSSGWGINAFGGTAIVGNCAAHGGVGINAVVQTNYDGHALIVTRNAGVTMGAVGDYPAAIIQCADLMGATSSVLRIITDCYNLGRVATGYIIDVLNYQTPYYRLTGLNAIEHYNNGTAPTAIVANAAQMWCADYAAGDARLYIMGEAQAGLTIFGNSQIIMTDPECAHGITTTIRTDAFCRMGWATASNGGFLIEGFNEATRTDPVYNDADPAAIALYGTTVGASYEDDCVAIYGGYKSGTARTTVPANQQPVFSVFVQGNDGFGTSVQQRALAVLGCGTVWGQRPHQSFDHGMTALYGQDGTAAYTKKTVWSISQNNNGGVQIHGLTNSTAALSAAIIKGTSGHASPTEPVVLIQGTKKNGTGEQALAAADPLFGIYNATTALAYLTGGNVWTYKNSTTAASAIVANASQMWCADYAAGDARLTFMGEKNVNTVTIGAGNVMLRPDTMADDSVSGETFHGQAGENLVWGNVVYLKSDGKFWKADFNAATTSPAVAFCTGTIAADASGEFLKRGWVRDDSAYNFTLGAAAGTIYLGESGAITQTAPTGVGDQVQVLGWALEADIWYFEPQLVVVEV